MNDAVERGKAVRKEMFGQPPLPPSEFRQPFDDFIHGYCFGEIWSRPTLSRKLRSMLTIAILTGLSRPNQLQAHVKAAIANGVTKEEIREVIMHAAVYCGIPAGADSFQQATLALKDIGLE
jgi:4-carboxymuconolactone decarboxylase